MITSALSGLAGGWPGADLLDSTSHSAISTLPYLFAGASGALAVASALTAYALWRRLRDANQYIKICDGRDREDLSTELVFMAAPGRLMPASPNTYRFLRDALHRQSEQEALGLDRAALEILIGAEAGERLNPLLSALVRRGEGFRIECADPFGGLWSFLGETVGARAVVRMIPLGQAQPLSQVARLAPPQAEDVDSAQNNNAEQPEPAAQAVEGEFQALLDAAPSGVVAFDAERRVIAANETALALLRLSADWVAGKPTLRAFLDHLHRRQRMPEQADYARWRQQALSDAAALFARRALWTLPNGDALRVSAADTPAGGLLLFVEDETPSRSLERRVRVAIGARRDTIAAVDQGLAVVGADGAVQLLNPAFARIWDLDREFGPGCAERFMEDDSGGRICLSEVAEAAIKHGAPEDAAIWEQVQAAALQRETPRRVEELEATRNGDVEQNLAIRVTPLPDGASLIACLDVSDSKAAEQALRDRAQALEAADTLKTEFLTDMAYQLRTPLNAVIGFADMLDQGRAGELDEKQKDYVGYVLSAANDLRELISDALDLGALRAGSLALRRSTFDLAGAAATVVGMAAKRAERRNALMVSNVPPIHLPVLGDERRLRHALFGALAAAINDAESGDEARLVVRAHENLEGADFAEILISLARRKPKRRLNHEAVKDPGGVSLSLAHKIIEAHGGVAQAEEAPEGLRVRFLLPLTDIEDADFEEAAADREGDAAQQGGTPPLDPPDAADAPQESRG